MHAAVSRPELPKRESAPTSSAIIDNSRLQMKQFHQAYVEYECTISSGKAFRFQSLLSVEHSYSRLLGVGCPPLPPSSLTHTHTQTESPCPSMLQLAMLPPSLPLSLSPSLPLSLSLSRSLFTSLHFTSLHSLSLSPCCERHILKWFLVLPSRCFLRCRRCEEISDPLVVDLQAAHLRRSGITGSRGLCDGRQGSLVERGNTYCIRLLSHDPV